MFHFFLIHWKYFQRVVIILSLIELNSFKNESPFKKGIIKSYKSIKNACHSWHVML